MKHKKKLCSIYFFSRALIALRRRLKTISLRFLKSEITWLFPLFLYSFYSHGEIIAIEKMILLNGQEVILMTDRETKDASLNQEQAITIMNAAKLLADNHPNSSIDFSYQDLGVYDVFEINASYQHQDRQNQTVFFETKEGITLIKEMQQTKFPDFSPETHFLLLRPRVPGISKFDWSIMQKTETNTTISSSFFTAALNQIIDEDWPQNLNIRSNDPNHSYLLDVTHDVKTFFNESSHAFSMRGLLILAPIFKRKIMMFQENTALFPFTNDENEETCTVSDFKKMFHILKEAEKQHLENFATLAWLKLKVPVDPSMLTMTISEFEKAMRMQHKETFGHEKNYHELKEGFSIELIQEAWALRENLQYKQSPILDVLLTIYSINAPHITVAVLQENLAIKLRGIMKNFGSVKTSEYLSLENLFEAIATL